MFSFIEDVVLCYSVLSLMKVFYYFSSQMCLKGEKFESEIHLISLVQELVERERFPALKAE